MQPERQQLALERIIEAEAVRTERKSELTALLRHEVRDVDLDVVRRLLDAFDQTRFLTDDRIFKSPRSRSLVRVKVTIAGTVNNGQRKRWSQEIN